MLGLQWLSGCCWGTVDILPPFQNETELKSTFVDLLKIWTSALCINIMRTSEQLRNWFSQPRSYNYVPVRCISSCSTAIYCVTPHYTILYHIILYHSIPHYTVQIHTILHRTTLHYTVLCHATLYFTILYYTRLYYAVLSSALAYAWSTPHHI